MTRYVILGLARQGIALAQYLVQNGAEVVVSDMQPAEKLGAALDALKGLKIEYVLGDHPLSLLDGADYLCPSGGVSLEMPIIRAALERGIGLTNDSQVFLEACPCKTVGITGSAGKTTTTTLVGRILALDPSSPTLPPLGEDRAERGARAVFVGGNIGHPLIADVAQMRATDIAVLELSSFQLEIMTCSPHVAAVLNITPNHLDRHGTMEAYTAAKSHILLHQTADDVAVLGKDNANARQLATFAKGRVAYFSEGAVEDGTFLRDEQIIFRWNGREQTVCVVSEIGLRGRHNVWNVLAACAISGAAGASVEQMRAGVLGFAGVPHRLEFVREVNGARWYNDSIASAPERVIAALHSFTEPLIVLAGGRDKKLPWSELAALAKTRVKHLVLFGEAGPLIEKALHEAGVTHYTLCGLLHEAVHVAAKHTAPGDVVLLSPGCTSFDAFKDFAERGEKFSEWVRQL